MLMYVYHLLTLGHSVLAAETVPADAGVADEAIEAFTKAYVAPSHDVAQRRA